MAAVRRSGPPLPLGPGGATEIAPGVDLLEDETGGALFLWGNAAWCWAASDDQARKLSAVQLIETKAASQREVAAAFSVNETTLWRWREDYATRGVTGLAPQKMGPKRPSVLTDEKMAEIVAFRERGLAMANIATATGVSLNTVSRALRQKGSTPRPRRRSDDLRLLARLRRAPRRPRSCRRGVRRRFPWRPRCPPPRCPRRA